MNHSSPVSLDVIVLSNTLNDNIFEMNKNCFNTLNNSEDSISIRIILIESNKISNYKYDIQNLKIIIPEEPFAFHKFINIGLKYCSAEFIAICNNDLVFHKNWFSEIYKIASEQPDILSFSPIDKKYLYMRRLSETNKDFYIGWEIAKHIAGWCIVLKKELLNIIDPFDERFNFYFSDNDYGFILHRNNIKHALITKSRVDHIEGIVTDQVMKDKKSGDFVSSTLRKDISLPKCLSLDKYKYIHESEQMLKDFLIFYEKWGEPLYLLKVSIIITTHNVDECIKDTVESALSQSWGNKEIIVVSYNSNNAAIDILQQNAPDNLKIYKTDLKTASAARNFGLKQSSGDLIQFLDAGYLLSKNKIEEQIMMYNRVCDNYAIITGGYILYKQDINDLAIPYIQTSTSCYINDSLNGLLEYLNNKQCISIYNTILHRDLINLTGDWSENLSYGDCDEYFTRLALNSNSIFFWNRGLTYYKDIPDSHLINMNEDDLKSQFDSLLNITSNILRKKNTKKTRFACGNFYVKHLDLFKNNPYYYGLVFKELQKLRFKLKPSFFTQMSRLPGRIQNKIKRYIERRVLQ